MSESPKEFGGATPEEIQRVRETECGIAGHIFEVVTEDGVLDPQQVLCSHCGRGWSMGGEHCVLSAEEIEAISDCISVTARMGSAYEIYGGVEPKVAVARASEALWRLKEEAAS